MGRFSIHNKGMGAIRRARTHRRRPQPRRSRQRLPYKPRHTLLSRGEAAFYFALRAAVRGQYLIAFKVRLADLITCSEAAWKAGFGHMIARHHLDFVLCDPRTTNVCLTIELDDRSHDSPSRKRRDTFVNDALAAAKIPLVRVRAASMYDTRQIGEAIAFAVGRG
ncbi:MAG: DUF2726 domain-containing protein [Pirellulales bacterium]